MDIAKVFISSVLNSAVEDLKAEREVVREVVNSYGFLSAWLFEKEPASAENLDESYLRHVDECNLFLLIVGIRITDPVTAEYLRAKELDKRILIFAKAVPERTPQVRLLLEVADVKYMTFETPEDLRQRARDAINEAIVVALSSPRERGTLRSNLSRLRKLADQKVRVRVTPIIPPTRALDIFQLEEVNTEKVVVHKVSSDDTVYIPTSRVTDVLPGAPNDPVVLAINGRLQWITPNQRWMFCEEKPKPECVFGFPKISNLQDPVALALIERFRQQGYTLY